MKNKKYIFIGNRPNVLKVLLKNKCNVKIFCIKSSFLEKYLIKNKIDHKKLTNKQNFINELKNNDFDILISNGCPYVLPISSLQKPNQLFINIHPSLLPDLKGKHPVNGAILFGRDAGVTCHIMNDNIDDGQIISQIKIPLTADIDLGLLYQLSFEAETDVFKLALKRGFKPVKNIPKIKNSIYYSRKEDDLKINFPDKPEMIIRQIKAFGIPSQCARFNYKSKIFKVLDANIISNKSLKANAKDYKNGQVIYKYNTTLIIKLNKKIIALKNIIGDLSLINVGDIFK